MTSSEREKLAKLIGAGLRVQIDTLGEGLSDDMRRLLDKLRERDRTSDQIELQGSEEPGNSKAGG